MHVAVDYTNGPVQVSASDVTTEAETIKTLLQTPHSFNSITINEIQEKLTGTCIPIKVT